MAVLQLEIDREATRRSAPYSGLDNRDKRIRSMLTDALNDTITEGGTLTVVVSGNKITAIQSPEAIGFDDPDDLNAAPDGTPVQEPAR